jgi:transcriptional regulatory protein LevR
MRLCLATFFLAATAENLDLWADHHLLVTENFKNKIGDNHTSELSLYLKSPVIPLQQNPIRWWDTNDITNSFPILAKIALKICRKCGNVSSIGTAFFQSRSNCDATTKQAQGKKGVTIIVFAIH